MSRGSIRSTPEETVGRCSRWPHPKLPSSEQWQSVWVESLLKMQARSRGVVAHSFNPSTQEAEAGRFLSSVRGQPGLQSEFQDSQGYTEKPCLEKTKKDKKNKS